MSCEKWLPLIEEFIDGELDDSFIKGLRAHLAACGDCSSEYRQLLKEQELYQNYMRDIEVTPALWAGVQARIQQNGAGPGIFARIRGRLASAFTAGPRLSPVYAMLLVLIAVAVTVIVMRRQGAPSATPGGNGSNPAPPIADKGPTPAPPPPGTVAPGPKETPKPGLPQPESTIAENR